MVCKQMVKVTNARLHTSQSFLQHKLSLNSDKTLHSYIPSGLNTCCLGSSLWGTDATEEELLNLFAAIAAACLNSKWSVSIS
jgi:hypothetical protein